jgi:hypothetical protein
LINESDNSLYIEPLNSSSGANSATKGVITIPNSLHKFSVNIQGGGGGGSIGNASSNTKRSGCGGGSGLRSISHFNSDTLASQSIEFEIGKGGKGGELKNDKSGGQGKRTQLKIGNDILVRVQGGHGAIHASNVSQSGGGDGDDGGGGGAIYTTTEDNQDKKLSGGKGKHKDKDGQNGHKAIYIDLHEKDFAQTAKLSGYGGSNSDNVWQSSIQKLSNAEPGMSLAGGGGGGFNGGNGGGKHVTNRPWYCIPGCWESLNIYASRGILGGGGGGGGYADKVFGYDDALGEGGPGGDGWIHITW